MNSALPDADTTRAAMQYLDDLRSSDGNMTRIACTGTELRDMGKNAQSRTVYVLHPYAMLGR